MQSHTMSRVRGYSLQLQSTPKKMQKAETSNHVPALPTTFVSGFHDEEAVKRTTYSRLGSTDMHVSKLSLGKWLCMTVEEN